jgi:hypothetical protein
MCRGHSATRAEAPSKQRRARGHASSNLRVGYARRLPIGVPVAGQLVGGLAEQPVAGQLIGGLAGQLVARQLVAGLATGQLVARWLLGEPVIGAAALGLTRFSRAVIAPAWYEYDRDTMLSPSGNSRLCSRR